MAEEETQKGGWVAAAEARIQELLEANNREVEKRRAAERARDELTRRLLAADGKTAAFPGTLRDWFAGRALAGLLASGPHDCDQRGIAHDAYIHADAMLAARERGR